MFHLFRDRNRTQNRAARTRPAVGLPLEPLEDRQLLSASHGFMAARIQPARMLASRQTSSIAFDLAPAAVQDGLTALASADSVTPPTALTSVLLGNANGILTYTVKVTGTGATTVLTVDASGKALAAPTMSTTTFGAIANAGVTDTFTAIATALGLTTPADTATVSVSTPASGLSTYTMTLNSSTTGRHARRLAVSVDANGNPVGNISLPLSVLSKTIQDALVAGAPAGATALTASSMVSVRTLYGVTTYSATYLGNGTRTTLTVNRDGILTNLPNKTTATFADAPLAAQTALQQLATAQGVTTAIDTTQSISVFDQGNGETIYTARLAATATSSSGSTYTYYITLSVDQNGNPTVLHDQSGEGGGDGGMFCM